MIDLGQHSRIILRRRGRTVILQVEFDAHTDDLADALHDRLQHRLTNADRVPMPQAILNELVN